MDDPAQAEDPLGQATRARLFTLLGELERPASTRELGDAVGLHVNGVRRHLERLAEAGLVERTRARRGRGRPRDEWAIAPGAEPSREPAHPYLDLARWLAATTEPTSARVRDAERVGREIGRSLVPEGAPSSAEGFRRLLGRLGFRSELRAGPAETVRCRLCNCPYRVAARENADVVCVLHRGITAGMLAGLAPEARLSAFLIRDPDGAGCEVEIAGTNWGEDPPTGAGPA